MNHCVLQGRHSSASLSLSMALQSITASLHYPTLPTPAWHAIHASTGTLATLPYSTHPSLACQQRNPRYTTLLYPPQQRNPRYTTLLYPPQLGTPSTPAEEAPRPKQRVCLRWVCLRACDHMISCRFGRGVCVVCRTAALSFTNLLPNLGNWWRIN